MCIRDRADGGAKPTNYTVNPGDTLWKIAHEALGDGDLFIELIKANPRLRRNPNRIFPGQILDLPGVTAPASPSSAPSSAPAPASPPAGN